MPLDGDVRTFVTTDPLEALGIVPVPRDFVRAYRKDYLTAFLRKHNPTVSCSWDKISYDEWKGRHRKNATLADFLANPTSARFASDKSHAPAELVRLAHHVQKYMPNAEFLVEYFDIDPILQVVYDLDGEYQIACLGIWDKGRITRIAEHPHIPAPPSLRWWQRLFC